MRRTVLTVAAASATMLLATNGTAQAIDAGAGVRGTLTLSWGSITGSPITSWNGSATLTFDPSAAARRATVAAARSSVGEARRPLFAPQTQAARVTALAGSKAERVLCQAERPDGSWREYWATSTSTVRSVADGRVAFEITRPVVNLRRGTGNLYLAPYEHADPNGWYVNDRFVLPGRALQSGSYPCPGGGVTTGTGRILAPNGQGAVPVVLTDWLGRFSSGEWRLRRTARGWQVVIQRHDRETFSESRFGPQDSQGIDLDVTSALYLAGSLKDLGARCVVPTVGIENAKTKRKALKLARRAGLTGTRFVGTKRDPSTFKARFVIQGGGIGNGTAPCFRGKPKLIRYAPPR